MRVKDSEEEITEYRFKDPRELALRAMGEIRAQLALQHQISRSLYDIAEVARFREGVLTAIGAVSPETRERIMVGLTEVNAITSSLSLSCPVSGSVDLEARARKAEALRSGKQPGS